MLCSPKLARDVDSAIWDADDDGSGVDGVVVDTGYI